MANRRYVFLNRFFHPDQSATSQLLSDLAFALAAADEEVHVICSRQLYEGASADLPEHEAVQGVQVHRAWSTRFGRARLIGRAFDYLSFYLGASWQLWRLARPGTVVVAKTDPPMVSVPAGWICRWRGATLVNWLQDVFPEVATALGITLFSGRFGRMLVALRDRSLRQARANVVLGTRMADHVARHGVARSAIHVIANWSDDETLRPMAHADNPLVARWDLADRFVVMYSGNMGRAHEFETMLAAAARLEREAPDVVFLFVGSGAQKATVAAQAVQRGLGNIVFRPYQDRALLAASLSVGHVHLISQQPATEGLIVPSKFYGVLGVGRPTLFVGDQAGELARIIHAHQVGATVEIGQADALVQAVLDFRADPQQREQAGERARALFLSHYAKVHALRHWAELLANVSDRLAINKASDGDAAVQPPR